MIIKYKLRVVTGLYFCSVHILFKFFIGVDINLLSVSLISEDEALVTVAGIYLEIRGVIGVASVGPPIEVAQISCLWKQLLFTVEVQSEVLCFKSVGVIDIPTYFILV